MQRLATVVLTLMFTVFLLNAVNAAAKKAPAQLQTDTSTIRVKKFNAAALNRYRTDKDFNYTEQAAGGPSFWGRFWEWVWNKLSPIFSAAAFGFPFIEFLLIAASFVFLGYVIAKSLGIDPIKLLRGEAAKIAVPYTESLENIHEINFDIEIEKAINQNNYRLAVRLLYLKCLKQLSDIHLIHWQIDKTNAAYLAELTNPDQKLTFGLITRQFEYVWYGNFAIDKQAFNHINLLFQDFKKQLP